MCDPASGHRGCVYCGEAVLQQPGGHSKPEGPKEAQGLSFQEGNRDLQLLLFQHHPGREAQQTGRRMEARNTAPLTDLFEFPLLENKSVNLELAVNNDDVVTFCMSSSEADRVPGGIALHTQHPRHESAAYDQRNPTQPFR